MAVGEVGIKKSDIGTNPRDFGQEVSATTRLADNSEVGFAVKHDSDGLAKQEVAPREKDSDLPLVRQPTLPQAASLHQEARYGRALGHGLGDVFLLRRLVAAFVPPLKEHLGEVEGRDEGWGHAGQRNGERSGHRSGDLAGARHEDGPAGRHVVHFKRVPAQSALPGKPAPKRRRARPGARFLSSRRDVLLLGDDIPPYVLRQKGFVLLSESNLDDFIESLTQRNGRRGHRPVVAVPNLASCGPKQLEALSLLLDRGVTLASMKRVVEQRCRLHPLDEFILPPPPSRWRRFTIRLLDMVFAMIGCAVFLAILPFVALAIWMDDGRPIFYAQERVGRGGRLFRLVKFRSMCRNAEESGPAWAIQGDERLTRVGAFLRRWKIDELPQFLNVLLGHMGMVGPRPIRPYFAEELALQVPHYDLRHLSRPGLTGWGTVKVGYGNSTELKYLTQQFDLYHVLNYSIRFNLEIIARTVYMLIFRPSQLTPPDPETPTPLASFLPAGETESNET